jgi:hypothetical protein
VQFLQLYRNVIERFADLFAVQFVLLCCQVAERFADAIWFAVQFVQFWRHVAERFADNPHVLGYEIMNEPWCGNTWQEPDLLIPGQEEEEERMNRKRQRDRQLIRKNTIS